MAPRVRLVLILIIIVCCLYNADCSGKGSKLQKRKQFPALVKPKNKHNPRKTGNKKRNIIIRCCGIKKCVGAFKKKPKPGKSNSKRNQSTTSQVREVKIMPTKITTEQPDNVENEKGSSESEAETQTVGKTVESSEAITETKPLETTTETPTEAEKSSEKSEIGSTELTSEGVSKKETTSAEKFSEPSSESVSIPDSSTTAISSSTLVTTTVPTAVPTTIPTTIPTIISNAAPTTFVPTTTNETTSTTTPCPIIRCKTFKDSSTLAATAATVFLAKKEEKIVAKNGTTFIVVSISANYSYAAAYCTKKGMNLVSLETEAESNLIANIAKERSFSEIWTSGIVDKTLNPCTGDLRINWCASNKTDNAPWWKENVEGLDESAISKAVSFKGSLLKVLDTNAALPFFCKCPRLNSCPATCKKKDNLFHSDGTLNEIGKKGNWRSICGNNYYFSSDVGTWEENWTWCCSLGMRPVWFKDAFEMDCLSKEMSNWTLNWNYWTGGTQQSCWGQWAWCSAQGPDPLVQGLRWAAGQPDNPQEGCLHLRIFKNTTGLVISDRNCSSKYVMACQGNPNVIKGCSKTECPAECVRNQSLFKTDNSSLKDYAKYGNWHNGCGREYLFANFNLTWNEAHKFCCSINARLLSVERLDFLDCLTSMVDKFPYAKYAWALKKEFWTTGTSKGCAGNLEWCSKNKKLDMREARWKIGHPKAEESCVFVSLFEKSSGENSTLGTSSCSEMKQFICEKPKRPKQAMQSNLECLETWNLTDAEMMYVQSPAFNQTTAPKHMKCYVRCVVAANEIFDFSSHSYSSNVVGVLEDANGDDDQSYQSAMDVLQNCSSKKHEDECDTAAEVYGCNNQNNPALTSAVISSVNNSSPDSADPDPVAAKTLCVTTHLRTCPEKVSCTVDEVKRNELLATKQNSVGRLLVSAKNRTYFMGQFRQSYALSELYCCQLGMKMATFATEEIFYEFATILPYLYSGMVFIGSTYDNGDNTDSWCDNYQLLPTNIINKPWLVYGDCSRPISNRIYITDGANFKMYDTNFTVDYFFCS